MKPSHSETQVQLRIILRAPPQGVDFGLQKGKGNDYTTIQIQRANGNDLNFTCSITVKDNQSDGRTNILGPFA
jgi:hypothetical protein